MRDAPLRERLLSRIRREGAISFRDWMAAALYDERAGYYSRSDLERWGRAGDYRTSPERSPLFAATFADYFAKKFEELNAPEEFTILEAGAGRGDFACAVLETLRREHEPVFARTRYVIDEVSADARERVSSALAKFSSRVEFRSLAQTKRPFAGVIFSNELLDALPVHRVVVREGKLRELCVGASEDGNFVWVECDPSSADIISYFDWCGVELEEGQAAEVNLEALAWIRRAASALDRGFVITVDYGAEAQELYLSPQRREGTLRAFHHHRFAADVLENPGEQDLTATINWTAVMKAGDEAGLKTLAFARQDRFLIDNGALERLERMAAESESESEAFRLRASARELILPTGMAASFQVSVQRKG